MLKGVSTYAAGSPLERTSFRSSWTQPEGAVGAFVFEARIVDVNVVNWTVDCVSVFDQRFFGDIQVASPYLHPNAGEGIYVMPEIGSKCLVCIPSDGPPPFVLSFILPTEPVLDSDGQGESKVTDSSFAGGRIRAKPGDIVLKGRDGNFCVLHRGGVLQIGSTELAQRIYIPLGNLVTDISQRYNHFNTGGAVNWGLVAAAGEGNPETSYKHTFRILADSEYADVRVAVGALKDPVGEHPDKGSRLDLEELEIGTKEKVVYEVALAPGGFDTDNGATHEKTRDLTRLRFFFDQGGSAMLRAEGSVSVRVKKKLRLRIDDDFTVYGKKNFTMEFKGTGRIVGEKSLELATNGGVLKLNGGTKPVAHVGSMVNVTLALPAMIQTSVGPGTILAGQVMVGQISSGNPTILV